MDEAEVKPARKTRVRKAAEVDSAAAPETAVTAPVETSETSTVSEKPKRKTTTTRKPRSPRVKAEEASVNVAETVLANEASNQIQESVSVQISSDAPAASAAKKRSTRKPAAQKSANENKSEVSLSENKIEQAFVTSGAESSDASEAANAEKPRRGRKTSASKRLGAEEESAISASSNASAEASTAEGLAKDVASIETESISAASSEEEKKSSSRRARTQRTTRRVNNKAEAVSSETESVSEQADASATAESSTDAALHTGENVSVTAASELSTDASQETKTAQEETPVQISESASSEADAEQQSAREVSQGSVSESDTQERENSSHNNQSKQQKNKQKQKPQQNQNNQNNKQNGHNNDHRRQRRHSQQLNREVLPSISKEELAAMKVGDLREKAAEYAIDASGLRKGELVEVIFEALCKAEGIIEIQGILDIMSDGYGFMRTRGYLPSEFDAYVSLSIIRRNGLRKGDYIVGQTRPARDNEKYAAIQKIISINGVPAEEVIARPRFADLTPIYPEERLKMEHGKSALTARVIDLVSPIGKGQRGLFVSPPKAGKTTVLKDVAAAISANNPEVHLMCLLVDERPEEVTDMERSIHGEVISSTFDMPCENHIAVSELVIERAKRLVEQGKDVVILLDSITRLARAYNMAQPASGRVLSGGVDSSALYPPKRFLGAARNIENGGSLTILGTALIETGSKMDEVIFEEFKGTGNMELKLDRALADRRIYPAIDVVASGTRKEELLIDSQEAPLIWAVRRVLSNMNNTERATDNLLKSLKQTDNNQEFLIRFAKKAQSSSGNVASSSDLSV